MSQTNRPRRLSFNSILLAIIAIPIALVTLLALAPLPGLPDASPLSQTIVQIVTVAGAIAVIVGILNLLSVHLRKLAAMQSVSALYSGITLLTLIVVLVLHFLELRGTLTVGGTGNQPALTLRLMDVLQVVIESALAGLLFFFLVYSAYRMMRRRVSIWGVIFIITLLIVLLGYALPPGSILASLRDWVLRVPVAAGTRGLLIGVAIGTISVGVRGLIGQDRIFRE
jgi:hypothetical protein